MSTKFHIPDTIDGVNRLLTMQKWEKAAIVWAYVHCYDGKGEPTKNAKNSILKPYTAESFAALGITGLRGKGTHETR